MKVNSDSQGLASVRPSLNSNPSPARPRLGDSPAQPPAVRHGPTGGTKLCLNTKCKNGAAYAMGFGGVDDNIRLPRDSPCRACTMQYVAFHVSF